MYVVSYEYVCECKKDLNECINIEIYLWVPNGLLNLPTC